MAAGRSSHLAPRRVAITGLATLAFGAVTLSSVLGLVFWLADDRERVVIWTDTRGGGPLTVAIDGRTVGALHEYYSVGRPDCSTSLGVISQELPKGQHVISGGDQTD